MASATIFEYLTASTTVRAPLTTSPLANTPSRVVWPALSVQTSPCRVVAISEVVLTILSFGPWLTATIVESAG